MLGDAFMFDDEEEDDDGDEEVDEGGEVEGGVRATRSVTGDLLLDVLEGHPVKETTSRDVDHLVVEVPARFGRHRQTSYLAEKVTLKDVSSSPLNVRFGV